MYAKLLDCILYHDVVSGNVVGICFPVSFENEFWLLCLVFNLFYKGDFMYFLLGTDIHRNRRITWLHILAYHFIYNYCQVTQTVVNALFKLIK